MKQIIVSIYNYMYSNLYRVEKLKIYFRKKKLHVDI